MCNPVAFMVVSMVFTAAAGYQQAQSAKAAGEYQEEVAKQNAEVDKKRAEYAAQLGNIEEEKQRARVRQVLGAQRATFAANNIEASSGTALDLQAETAQVGEEDALAIRANAARQAWGYQVDAQNSIAKGRLAKATGKNEATGTYLSTGANLASQGYNYFGGGGRG